MDFGKDITKKLIAMRAKVALAKMTLSEADLTYVNLIDVLASHVYLHSFRHLNTATEALEKNRVPEELFNKICEHVHYAIRMMYFARDVSHQNKGHPDLVKIIIGDRDDEFSTNVLNLLAEFDSQSDDMKEAIIDQSKKYILAQGILIAQSALSLWDEVINSVDAESEVSREIQKAIRKLVTELVTTESQFQFILERDYLAQSTLKLVPQAMYTKLGEKVCSFEQNECIIEFLTIPLMHSDVHVPDFHRYALNHHAIGQDTPSPISRSAPKS